MAAPTNTRKKEWKNIAIRMIHKLKESETPYEADLLKIDYIIIHQ